MENNHWGCEWIKLMISNMTKKTKQDFGNITYLKYVDDWMKCFSKEKLKLPHEIIEKGRRNRWVMFYPISTCFHPSLNHLLLLHHLHLSIKNNSTTTTNYCWMTVAATSFTLFYSCILHISTCIYGWLFQWFH